MGRIVGITIGGWHGEMDCESPFHLTQSFLFAGLSMCSRHDDLWCIWQREHGIRIREKDGLLRPQNTSRMRVAVDGLREFGRWIKRARAFAIGRTEERPSILTRAASRARESYQDLPRPRLRRAASESDIRKSSDGASTISVPGSFVERLGGLDLSRTLSMNAEGKIGRSASESEALEDHGPLKE